MIRLYSPDYAGSCHQGGLAHSHSNSAPAVPWASSHAIEVIELTHDSEGLPSSEIGIDGESFLPSSPLMTIATDETFEVADVQLVTNLTVK